MITMVINKESITKIVYFIKRTFFEGENNEVIELTSLTREYTQIINRMEVVSPEILVSSLREVALSPDIDLSALERKMVITEQQALKIAKMEDDQEGFIKAVDEII